MLRNEKLLFDELYEKTKDCSRVQIVKLLMTKERENEQLKMINKEYERLNKENGRGFKITNVKEYDIDELLSYKKHKDNWNKLKEYIDIKLYNVEYLQKLCGCRIDDEIHMILDIIKKEMKELEKESNSNAKD